MLAGSPLWTTMSTCAWTATTLQLKTGWKSTLSELSQLSLIFRGSLGAGTILGGAGGSSVINSLKSYPDLIKKYQGLSKKPPELEKFGPIIELINTQNMKPAQVWWSSIKSYVKSWQLRSFSSTDIFRKMHWRRLPCSPSLCQQNRGMCPKVSIFFLETITSNA